MSPLKALKNLCLAAGAVIALSSAAAAGPARSGPEKLWLAQTAEATTEGNAGALQMQQEIVNKLRAIGVDYPEGQFMTMDQVDRLTNLFNLGEGEAETRDQAKAILGM